MRSVLPSRSSRVIDSIPISVVLFRC
jgi:hypothetical protein